MKSSNRVLGTDSFDKRSQETDAAQSGVESQPGNPCRVAFFYDNRRTRAWLLRFCGALAYQFEADIEFEFTWWKIQFFRDSVIAEVAASEAAQADVLVYAGNGDANVPEELQAFNELWLAQRGFREGFLIALTKNTEGILRGIPAWPAHLHDVATRAHMKFATEFLSAPATEDSESIEGLAQRAQRITPTLDQILERSRPTSHWGINE